MNCEEYRQRIAAEPSFDGGAGHLSECADCRTYRREMIELDGRICRALAINVPPLEIPELPDIEAGNVSVLPRRRLSAPAWAAMAATVVLAAFIGIRMTGIGADPVSLADQLLAHVDHEPYALRVSDEPVAAAHLAAVVPANVARLDHSAGLITYAQSCVINGHDVPHLVIQGERGPVTVLLMPHEMVNGPQKITGESVNGVILPVGDGSIAIFGAREESLQAIERKVLESVTWST